MRTRHPRRPLVDAGGSKRPSRAEIEGLCILHAVGPDGCPESDLAGRLGLSPALAGAAIRSIGSLVDAGWLAQEDNRISLTGAGRAWLEERLSQLRVGSRAR